MSRRAVILVLDGVGIGAAPDAAAYGDVGSNTLGNVARALGGLHLPNLQAVGLGNVAPLMGVSPVAKPLARMTMPYQRSVVYSVRRREHMGPLRHVRTEPNLVRL